MVYELLGMTGSGDAEIEVRPSDQRLSQMTWKASEYFEKGNLNKAARCYQKILEEFPRDPVAPSMLEIVSTSVAPAGPIGAGGCGR